MTRHLLFLFIIILLLMSGCNGNSTLSEPSQVTAMAADSMVSPAIKGVPSSSMPTTAQSTPNVAISSASTSPTKPSVPTKSDSIIGDTLKDQSFQVINENFGDFEFITTEEKVNDKNRPHFYFKKGDSVAELKYDQNRQSLSITSLQSHSGM